MLQINNITMENPINRFFVLNDEYSNADTAKAATISTEHASTILFSPLMTSAMLTKVAGSKGGCGHRHDLKNVDVSLQLICNGSVTVTRCWPTMQVYD